ncbi:MAG: glycosyltransferase family 2 protein [Gemmatimonadales bacterium]
MSRERPLLSVIVPAYNGMKVLPRCLEALRASDLPRPFWELIVVDDASTDETASLAAGYADTVVRLSRRPHGPSYARNRGAEVARGEIVVFVDADVCVHPDTLSRFAWLFVDDPELAAAFGSYDANPPATGLVSQYRNLLHHYVHQQSAGEAETFWAGCGAIRLDVFRAVGMYNEWQFSRPQVEDIELGHRLRDRGHRILLRPEIQATHLKRWTLLNVLATDLKDRGVPWTRLLIQRGETIGARALNLRLRERVCTALTWLALLLAIGAAAFLEPWLLVPCGLLLSGVLATNLPLYGFFKTQRGFAFALRVVPLHLAYYILNGVSVGTALVLHHALGDPQPSASVQAFAERGVIKWPPVPRPVEGSPARPSAGGQE